MADSQDYDFGPGMVTLMDVDDSMMQTGQAEYEYEHVQVKSTVKLGRTGRPKRIRTNYTSDQLSELENYFKNTRYLNRPNRIEMAKKLNLNERQVKIWFQNRRMKEKRETQVKPSSSKSSKNRPISPSQSLSSNISSPSSHRSRSPQSDNQLSDQQIRENLMQYQNFQFVTRERAAQDANTVYRPVYETYVVSSGHQMNAAQQPLKLEPNLDQEQSVPTVNEVHDFVEQELLQNYGFVALPGENNALNSEFLPGEFEEFKQSRNCSFSSTQDDLNASKGSIGASSNPFDLYFPGLLFDNVHDPLDLPNDVSTSWPLCPQDEDKENNLLSL